MRIGQRDGVLTRMEELNYMVTWFSEFSEMQKDDFLEIVTERYGHGAIKQCNGMNGKSPALIDEDDVDGEKRLNGTTDEPDDEDKVPTIEEKLARRPPSIFECRMKLFRQWFVNWNDGDKQDFLNRLRNLDNEFMTLFDAHAEGRTINVNCDQPPMFACTNESTPGNEQTSTLNDVNDTIDDQQQLHNGDANEVDDQIDEKPDVDDDNEEKEDDVDHHSDEDVDGVDKVESDI